MKKFLSFILMVCLVLTGCSNAPEKSSHSLVKKAIPVSKSEASFLFQNFPDLHRILLSSKVSYQISSEKDYYKLSFSTKKQKKLSSTYYVIEKKSGKLFMGSSSLRGFVPVKNFDSATLLTAYRSLQKAFPSPRYHLSFERMHQKQLYFFVSETKKQRITDTFHAAYHMKTKKVKKLSSDYVKKNQTLRLLPAVPYAVELTNAHTQDQMVIEYKYFSGSYVQSIHHYSLYQKNVVYVETKGALYEVPLPKKLESSTKKNILPEVKSLSKQLVFKQPAFASDLFFLSKPYQDPPGSSSSLSRDFFSFSKTNQVIKKETWSSEKGIVAFSIHQPGHPQYGVWTLKQPKQK